MFDVCLIQKPSLDRMVDVMCFIFYKKSPKEDRRVAQQLLLGDVWVKT